MQTWKILKPAYGLNSPMRAGTLRKKNIFLLGKNEEVGRMLGDMIEHPDKFL